MTESTSECLIFRVSMADPSDVSEVAGLFDDGIVDPSEIVAVLGKTEGNGCVNDFSRGYATLALRSLLVERGVSRKTAFATPMIMSGGTEGGLSPHFLIFAVRPSSTVSAKPTLAIGVAHTRAFDPAEIGRMDQVRETARAVRTAMAHAKINDPSDVHLVQVKCPLLTQQKLKQVLDAGGEAPTDETYASMGFSRGASALGVALALGEIDEAVLSDEVICRDHDLWSGRASASAGSELDHSEVIVLGNSRAWAGDKVIHHAVMQDGIDVDAVYGVLDAIGLTVTRQLGEQEREKVKAVIVKAEPARGGRIRGARHIMWDDSDINPTRHARALVGGVIAGIIGRTDLFVSGGAEHQGPDGGGPIAIIATRPDA